MQLTRLKVSRNGICLVHGAFVFALEANVAKEEQAITKMNTGGGKFRLNDALKGPHFVSAILPS